VRFRLTLPQIFSGSFLFALRTTLLSFPFRPLEAFPLLETAAHVPWCSSGAADTNVPCAMERRMVTRKSRSEPRTRTNENGRDKEQEHNQSDVCGSTGCRERMTYPNAQSLKEKIGPKELE